MKKIIFVMVSALLTTPAVHGQSSGFSEILAEIEQNNKTLQAHAAHIDASSLADQQVNAIDPMAVDALYLPFGKNSSPQYFEVQVSQQFEFPSVYRTRSDYFGQQRLAREAAYQMERQDILADALDLCTRLVYLHKREAVETQRVDRARRLYENIREMYDREQIGRLELNKARVTWLQRQFALEALEAQRAQLLDALRGLNGGEAIAYSDALFAEYDGPLALAPADSLWQEKRVDDPNFQLRSEMENAALKNISVTKKERLPQFGVGVNYQGFRGDNYAGFAGGLSLPLWRNKTKLEMAEAAYAFEVGSSEAQGISAETEFQSMYKKYVALLERFTEYQATLAALDSEELLQIAFELGEYAYLEYYMELTFYQDAYDEMMRMEVELYALKNQLLKHQL